MRDIHLVIVLTVLCHAVAAGARVALSLYAIELGGSALTVGLITGIYGLLPMLFSVAAGRLSDRVGARKPMLFGAAALAAGSIIPFTWPSMAGLYVTSCLVGSGFMFYNVAMQNVAGHIGPPEDRASNLSLISLGFSFSTMIGPTLAGVSIDVVGHRSTFLVFGLLTLFPVYALASGLLRVPDVPGQRPGAGKGRFLDLFRDRLLARIFLTSGLMSMAWELYSFIVPVYGSSVGLSPSAIGLVMGAFSAAILVVRIFLPLFARRLDALQAITLTLVYAAALYVLFPLFRDPWALAALSFLLGLGLGIPQPLVIVLLHSSAPQGRVGEAIGFRQALIYASQAFMPIVFGALAAVSMALVFWASAFCFAAGSFAGKWRRG